MKMIINYLLSRGWFPLLLEAVRLAVQWLVFLNATHLLGECKVGITALKL
jgi:hypothetical protein